MASDPTPPFIPPSARLDPRGVLEVDWPLFGELSRALALRVYHDYDPDVIIGIARAGVIPGAVVASILQREFASMAVTRIEEGALPHLVTAPPPSVQGHRVLIVDETCDSGHTLKLALHEVRLRHPVDVRTAVSIRTGPYEPDYYALATEQYIVLPWDREVIENGELAIRPDYRPYLQDGG